MSELPPILKALANERKSIAYRPELATMTGSVLAAILLQQILFRFDNNECDKFYKFAQPCKHKLYKEGDSWTEELAFSRSELATALKKIGTKSTKGTNKAELMAVDQPEFDDKGLLKNANRLVIYWTDKSRVTWYWLNTALLGNAINMNYLGNSTIVNYLVNQESDITYKKQESGFISIPETTTETTNTSAPKSTARSGRPKKPTTPKEILNPMADEVMRVFGWDWNTASKNEKSKARGAAKGLCDIGRTPDEVSLFYAECRKRGWKNFSPNALLNVVSDVAKKQSVKIIPLEIDPADYPDTSDYIDLAGVSHVS